MKIFRKRQHLNNKNNSTSHTWLAYRIQLRTYALDFKKVVSFDQGHKRLSCYLEISLFYLFIYKFNGPKVEKFINFMYFILLASD